MRIRIFYFLNEALESFKRNWVMSFAAVVTVFFSVILVGFAILAGNIVGKTLSSIENRVEINVFLKDSVTLEQKQQFEVKLKTFKEVQSLKYISKDEALKIFKEDHKNQPDLIDEIRDNPLPASYQVTLKNPRDVIKVADKIDKLPERTTLVDDVKYAKDTIKKIFVVVNVARYIFYAFLIVLSLASLILISNTVRLAIYARRKEVAVMRLVGASNWFIRWPFLLEGILQGLIGAFFAVLVMIAIKMSVLPTIQKSLSFLSLGVSGNFYLQLIIWLLVAGVSIGALGSFIALRRYLKI